jgi:hypothetical protein
MVRRSTQAQCGLILLRVKAYFDFFQPVVNPPMKAVNAGL